MGVKRGYMRGEKRVPQNQLRRCGPAGLGRAEAQPLQRCGAVLRIHGERPVRLGAGTGVPCPYNDVALRAWVALKRSPYNAKSGSIALLLMTRLFLGIGGNLVGRRFGFA